MTDYAELIRRARELLDSLRDDRLCPTCDASVAPDDTDKDAARLLAELADALEDAYRRLEGIASLTTDCPASMEEAEFYRTQLQIAIGAAARGLSRGPNDD